MTNVRSVRALASALAVLLVAALVVVANHPRSTAGAAACGKRYVAGGDDYPAGHDTSDSSSYPAHLLNDHLTKYPGPWCKYGSPTNGTTSATYISGGQLATARNMQPDLITLTVGEQNDTISNIINDCFDDVKDHDFEGAMTCAEEIKNNSNLWSTYANNLASIFGAYKQIMSGRPKLMVAVTTYPNPYPRSSDVQSDISELCDELVDTVPTCEERWQQLPPALDSIDSVFTKLNDTIKTTLQPFNQATQGRFVVVDTYDKFTSHCMQMDVSIQTQVDHGDYADEHDSEQDFGCSNPWFVAGDAGTTIPDYLEPAEDGALTGEEQETTGMGVYPTDDGQKCISDLIWEAVKIKLGVGEAPKTDICQ